MSNPGASDGAIGFAGFRLVNSAQDAFDASMYGNASTGNGELTWLLNKHRPRGLMKMGMFH